MITALAAAGVLLLIAIFGVLVARSFAPPFAPSLTPNPRTRNPYEWQWWRYFGSEGEVEVMLNNGELWRGPVSWSRYPDGKNSIDMYDLELDNALKRYEQQIKWATGDATEKLRIGMGADTEPAFATEFRQRFLNDDLHGNECSGCKLRKVSIPGGFCFACRSAQGAP